MSNNNAATANVLEKLDKYGVGFIAAYLGNMENKARFFAEQKTSYPEMNSWFMDLTTYHKQISELESRHNELNEMLQAKNRIAELNQELSAIKVEQEYFKNYYRESNEDIKPFRTLFRQSSAKTMALWVDYQLLAKDSGQLTLKHKLKYLVYFGIVNFSFFDDTPDRIVSHFQKLYYEQRSKELNDQIEALTKRLGNYHFDDAMKKYSEGSMKLFKAELAKRYASNAERPEFSKESLWRDFGSFIKEYPVILSTTHSIRNCANANYLYDYVIMDEASQVDIVTGALALSCAKKAIIVGDVKQLPNVVNDEARVETNLIYERFTLDNAYHFADNSMLSSITKLFKDVPRTLLKEHYRCHPKIIGFCNQKFYNNELILLTDENEGDKPLVAYKTAKGNHARGTFNQRQIDVILEEVLPQFNNGEQSIGIISPYRLQTDKLKSALQNSNIEVDTVHKYQGREKDIIILTTVVNEVNEFVNNPNLINVAVSRAAKKLIVIVSDNEKNNNSNIGDLIKYIDYNNFEIINSSIYSVFDLLYQNYSKHLLATMKNRKKVSAHKSENLMNAVIEKVLSQPEFQNIGFVMHQPLKMLIRNPEKLEETECSYAMNIFTHTDFLIYNKLDKMPVLAVEVDGYAFHANKPEQLARDKMKDKILQKYSIPILRMSTVESREEERLNSKLSEVLASSLN